MIADLVGRGNELAKYKAELAEVEKQRDIKLSEIEELEEYKFLNSSTLHNS